ncbi:MAG: ABC transporter substrate-binding protein [Ruminococcaceae bacterium]|nr:ABC transporter substrate-binding protein [Oscillospiraceae bacterium]
MKKLICSALCVALSALLLAGCGHPEPEFNEVTDLITEPETENTPTSLLLPTQFSLAYMPDQTLDPITCPDGMQQTVASLLYEGLFRLDGKFQPEPALCESFVCDEDFLSYTFTLRSGVLFSDGSPLTAADVKSTLDRARTSNRYRARLADILSVSAGENTVTVLLSSPNNALPALLDIPIVKAGTETAHAPTGTGPYFFSAQDAVPCLVANRLWRQGTGQPTERITLVEAADQSTMLYRLSSHDIQLAAADLTGSASVSLSGSLTYQDTDTTILQYLGCNLSREYLNTAAFRRALNCGINRAHIVSAFLSGHGRAAQLPLSPVSALYPSELEQPFSMDAFSAALAECEALPTKPLTLLVNEENNFKTAIAAYLAESFSAAGVAVEVRALPWEAYTAALAQGDFDLYYGEVRLSADWDLSPLLAKGGALNFGGWGSAQTDSLLAACAASPQRDAAITELCAHLKTFSPILPICFKSSSVLLQTNVVEGLISTATEPFYNVQDCTIHLQSQ